MRRIIANPDRIVTDSDIQDEITGLSIPFIDVGESWKEKRTVMPDGTILDEVVSSGEKGINETWQIEAPQQSAIKNSRDAKRQRDLQSGRLVETL